MSSISSPSPTSRHPNEYFVSGKVEYNIVIPLIFLLLDGCLVLSSFMVGILGLITIKIGAMSVHLQQFILNRRNTLKTIYDVSKIDYNEVLESVNHMNDILSNQYGITGSQLYSREFVAAIQVAIDRVLFDDGQYANEETHVYDIDQDEEEEDEDSTQTPQDGAQSDSSSNDTDSTSDGKSNFTIASSSRDKETDLISESIGDEESDDEEDNRVSLETKGDTEGSDDGRRGDSSTTSSEEGINDDDDGKDEIVVHVVDNIVKEVVIKADLTELEKEEEEQVDKYYLHQSAVVF